MKERAGKKKVVLELGGNAGVIIDKSADLDWAVKRNLVGAFAYAGQVCISVQRAFVHEDVWDEFMPRLVAGAEALKVGDPLDPTTDVGPMVDEHAASRTQRWVDEAVALGGTVLTGGKADGTFFPPTVLTDVPHHGRRLLERGLRPARRRREVPRARRGDREGERQHVRAPDRGLHQRPHRRVAGVRRRSRSAG